MMLMGIKKEDMQPQFKNKTYRRKKTWLALGDPNISYQFSSALSVSFVWSRVVWQ